MSQPGYVAPLDNCLLMAHSKFQYSHTGAGGSAGVTVGNMNYMFTQINTGTSLTYGADFDEQDGEIEFLLQGLAAAPYNGFMDGLDVNSVFLQFGINTNQPLEATVTVTGNGGAGDLVASRTVSLAGNFRDFIHFEGFNQNNNKSIKLTLRGVKDKTQPVYILHLGAKTKVSDIKHQPYISAQGGTCYGDIKTTGFLIRKPDGTYARITVNDLNQLTVANG